jgi:hypothetical protein
MTILILSQVELTIEPTVKLAVKLIVDTYDLS